LAISLSTTMRWYRLRHVFVCIIVWRHWVRVSCLVIHEGPIHSQDQTIEVDLFDTLEGFNRKRAESWDKRAPIPESTEDIITQFNANRPLYNSSLARAPAISSNSTSIHDKAFFLHIPKTGGHSFDSDGRSIFGTLDQAETCYSEVASQTVVTFFREPRRHVFSQYWHCVGGGHPVPAYFKKWVHDWADFSQSEPLNNMTDKHRTDQMRYPCFNPINKQTQKMTCAQADRYPSVIDVDLAIRNMHSVSFVGLLELYPESLCVFHAKASGEMPRSCDCRYRADGLWRWHHDFGFDHHMPTDPRVLKDVDALTGADRQLYEAASTRFLRDLREVEMRHGVKILCAT